MTRALHTGTPPHGHRRLRRRRRSSGRARRSCRSSRPRCTRIDASAVQDDPARRRPPAARPSAERGRDLRHDRDRKRRRVRRRSRSTASRCASRPARCTSGARCCSAATATARRRSSTAGSRRATAGAWTPMGELVVDGRIGELIITGGENVWPQAVEAVLLRPPGGPRRRRRPDARTPNGAKRSWPTWSPTAIHPRSTSCATTSRRRSPPTTLRVLSCWSTRGATHRRSARSSAQGWATRYPEAPVGSCRRVTAILDAGQGTATHPGCA